ncbi:MAG: peroxiredoxin [Pseudomonadales bacterium]|nr:peroxiredoxin [Pseudomonadales bacterium]
MSIEKGQEIPSLDLQVMGEKGPKKVSTTELFSNKKVVMFAVPGAFTPTCSMTHLPGYITNADKIKAKGVDTIICVSVNDAFVMGAWGKAQNAEALVMLADGSGELAKGLGLELDATGFGMGKRSQRYAMIVDNGVVSHLAVEPAGGLEVSDAESILAVL